MKERSVNLVFQGGGVRGIAYAGVLSAMPEWIRISGAGGTSAGALVAALLAIGKRGDQLRDILADPKLFCLLRKEDTERRKRIIDVSRKYMPEIQKLLGDSGGLQAPSAWKYILSGSERKRVSSMYRFWQSASADLAAMARDLKFVWEAKGMHSSEPLRTWLDKVLDYKRFEHLEGIQNGIPDLRIVATSVSTQEYQVYDSARHGGMELAEAVHASVSIPIFFQPFVTGGGSRFLVDGGVLSNFPSFLFAQSPDPTIGLRLEDLPPLTRIEEIERAPGKPLPIRSTLDYLLLLLKTMVEAHDAFRELPPDFHLYRVPVPDDISFDKFDLTKVDVDRLYDKATQVKVNWEDDSRSSGKPRTFDPNPQQALTFGIEQGAALIQRHYSPDMWAQSFEQTVHFEVTIEEDWSSLYQRTMELKVEGEQPIFVIRLVSSGLPKGPNSLADHVPKYEEIVDGKNSRKNVILIPASNEAESKGFVAFLDPPLRGGVGPRKFWMEQRIKEEFANVGKSGGSGLISYYARQRAKTHVLKLQIQVRVAEKLGELTFKSETDEQIIPGPLYEDPATHRIYRVYTSGMHEIPVNREGGIAVYFRRA